MINVAAVQMVSCDVVDKNLSNAEKLIAEAVGKQAKFVTLPENFPMMGKKDDYLTIREPLGIGPIQTFLSEQARKNYIWLLGGTIPLKSEEPDKAYPASLLYNPKGECIACYKKIHLFDVIVNKDDNQESYRESINLKAGNKVVVSKTEIGNIGLSVCYDLRFPELYRMMHQDNVQIITIPSAFTAITGEAHWESLLRTRAIENLCYIMASNQGGNHVNGRKTWGHSMIIDPWGKILAELKQDQGVAVATIDLEMQLNLRKRFPALEHRRL